MAVTNLGLKAITGLVGNIDTQTAFGYLALGTSATAFAAAQTGLQAEITDTGLARAAATGATSEQTTVADDTLQLTKTWTATGSKTIAEVGVFNAASSGVMLARTVLGTARVLESSFTYGLTYKVKFAAA